MMDFSLEQEAWLSVIDALPTGGSIGAVTLLALLQQESQEAVEEAMEQLQARRITLNVRELPQEAAKGPEGERLAFEQRLAKQEDLRQGLDATDPLALFLEDLASTPTTGNIAAPLSRYQAGDASAAGELAGCMFSAVIQEARELTGHGVLLLDLIQEGALGLWQAIGSYEQGDFEEHCLWHMRFYMAKAVVLQAASSGVGRKMAAGMQDYLDADSRLLVELGRNPTLEEIAQALSITPEEAATYSQGIQAARSRRSKEPEPEKEEELAVEDTAYFQTRQRVAELLSGLTEEETRVIELRFGLDGKEPKTPQQVAVLMNMTPQQVLQMEAAALGKLKKEG